MRRVLRAAVAIGLALLSVWAWTLSPWGRSRMGRFAEQMLDAAFDGHFAIGSLSITGPWAIRLRDVLISDDRGDPVIAARRVAVDLDPAHLIVGRFKIDHLRVDGGRFELALVEDTLTVSRAFTPHGQVPEKREHHKKHGAVAELPPPPPFEIDLRELKLTDTAYRQSESPGGPPVVEAVGIDLLAHGSWKGSEARLVLELDAKALAPVRDPLHLDLEASYAHNLLQARGVNIRVGETTLQASGTGDTKLLEGTVLFTGLAATAETSQLQIPLGKRATIDGRAELSRQRIAVGVHLDAPGGGQIVAGGSLAPPTGRLAGSVLLRGVDPSVWVGSAPRGFIDGTFRIEGTKDSLAGHVALLPSRLRGAQIGPARIEGTYALGQIHLDPSRLEIPGAALSLSGNASATSVDVEAELSAPDIGEALATLGKLLEQPLPTIRGEADAKVHVTGSPRAPEVAFQLRSPRLGMGSMAATGVDLRGSAALGGALPSGSLQGSLGTLRAGRLVASTLRIEASRTAAGPFQLSARGRTAVVGRNPAASSLEVAGRIVPGRLDLDRLALLYPGGSLRMNGSSSLTFGPRGISLDRLALEGPGHVTIAGHIGEGALSVDVQTRDLYLSRLPQALLPRDAAGVVAMDASVRGPIEAPHGHVRFQLSGGRYGTLPEIAARGSVDMEKGRAAGTIAAALGGAGVVRGNFDVPVAPMTAPGEVPLSLELTIGPVRLTGLSEALDQPLPAGVLRAWIKASGELSEPDVSMKLSVENLRDPAQPAVTPLTVQMAGQLDQGLASVQAEVYGAARRLLELTVKAPLDPRALRRDPAAEIQRMLTSARSAARAEARGLDLRLLGAAIGKSLHGAAEADIDLQGPITDPRGTVDVALAGGPLGPMDLVDARAHVELQSDATVLEVQTARDHLGSAIIKAKIDAGLRALLDANASASAPVAAVIDIDRLQLKEFMRKEPSLRPGASPAPALEGILDAHGSFSGTLGALQGELSATATSLAVNGHAIGDVEARIFENAGSAGARLDLIDPTAGTLTATLDLSRPIQPLEALARGTLILATPARIAVHGVALSPGPLAVLPYFRSASGKVSIDGEASGPLDALAPAGKLSIQDGKVETSSGTVYEAVAADATANGQRLTLGHLSARAPGGSLEASGTVERGKPGPFQLKINSHAFPVAAEGGLAAKVSFDGDVQGTASMDKGVEASVNVRSARIELPQKPPRELQEIGIPQDVVIVGSAEERRRQAAARGEQKGSLPLHVHLSAPSRAFVVSQDFDVEVAADVTGNRDAAGDLTVSGEAHTRRGRVKAIGRSFTIEQARVMFTGGPVDDGHINATARWDSTAIQAFVDVSGTVGQPKIALRSEPPLPESQIALLIASGRTTLPGQTSTFEPNPTTPAPTAAGTAASVAGSFLVDKLRQSVGPQLPVDVLTVQSGAAGTRVEAGKYVSGRLYLGVSSGFGRVLPGENLNEVQAEYDLSRNLALQSRYGDRGNGGLDLVWRRDFPTAAQKEARQPPKK